MSDNKNNKNIYVPSFNVDYHQNMSVGETKNFKCVIEGKEDEKATYVSDTPNICTIDQEGNVTVINEGEGYIAAEIMGKRARLNINAISIEKGKKEFIAHKGLSGLAPENTIESFKLAIDHELDYIEIMLQVTRDKELIVFSDETLRRLFADYHTVGEMELKELKLLEFQAGNHLDEYPGVTIATFKEVLELVKDSKIGLEIVLKDKTFASINMDSLKDIVDLVREYHMEERVVFACENRYTIEAFRRITDEFKFFFIIRKISELDERYLLEHHLNLSVKYSIINMETITRLHDQGVLINLWVINNRSIIRKLIDYPVDLITTDFSVY